MLSSILQSPHWYYVAAILQFSTALFFRLEWGSLCLVFRSKVDYKRYILPPSTTCKAFVGFFQEFFIFRPKFRASFLLPRSCCSQSTITREKIWLMSAFALFFSEKLSSYPFLLSRWWKWVRHHKNTKRALLLRMLCLEKKGEEFDENKKFILTTSHSKTLNLQRLTSNVITMFIFPWKAFDRTLSDSWEWVACLFVKCQLQCDVTKGDEGPFR